VRRQAAYFSYPQKKIRLGGAGIVAQVSESVSGVSPGQGQDRTMLRGLWNRRAALKRIPGLTRLFRWYNWEILGNGEYIQIIARKNSDVAVQPSGETC